MVGLMWQLLLEGRCLKGHDSGITGRSEGRQVGSEVYVIQTAYWHDFECLSMCGTLQAVHSTLEYTHLIKLVLTITTNGFGREFGSDAGILLPRIRMLRQDHSPLGRST
jgi:hypothetical protein